MTLIGENNASATPSVSELGMWADNFGLTFPVLADGSFGISGNHIAADPGFDGYIYMPNMQLIGPGMEVIAVNEFEGISSSLIEANLPD